LLHYWLLFAFFALGAMVGRARANSAQLYSSPALMLGGLSIALMIGFRDHIGTDWINYVRMFRRAGFYPLHQVLGMGDPGYMFLNWTVQQMGGPFWAVNLFCGAVFAWGLYRFVTVQADPWLAALVAIPYLVIVVAMGYSRQAVAIGILMAGLADLIRNRGFWRFFGYAAVASLFHASAAMVLPLAIVGLHRQRLAQFTILPVVGWLSYNSVFSNRVDQFVDVYVNRNFNSQGALVRVLLCVLPAAVYFLFRKRLRFTDEELVLWRNFSIAAFVCLILLYVLPSSTIVDRVALYLLPLEIAVLPRLKFLIRSPLQARALIVIFSSLVLWVWLNFAANSGDWVPYRHY